MSQFELDNFVVFAYTPDMTQTLLAQTAMRDNVSTRVPESVAAFIEQVAQVRRITRSQAARLLLTVVWEQMQTLSDKDRAKAIRQLG